MDPAVSPDPPGATARAAAFIDAIAWGEHTTVWELLSADGRATALGVAMHNGLDRVVAGRISEDLADPTEREQFLQQLVGGLRRDLRGVDIDNISAVEPTSSTAVGRTDVVAVELTTPSTIPGTHAWLAGTLFLSHTDANGWQVDRLEPRFSGP